MSNDVTANKMASTTASQTSQNNANNTQKYPSSGGSTEHNKDDYIVYIPGIGTVQPRDEADAAQQGDDGYTVYIPGIGNIRPSDKADGAEGAGSDHTVYPPDEDVTDSRRNSTGTTTDPDSMGLSTEETQEQDTTTPRSNSPFATSLRQLNIFSETVVKELAEFATGHGQGRVLPLFTKLAEMGDLKTARPEDMALLQSVKNEIAQYLQLYLKFEKDSNSLTWSGSADARKTVEEFITALESVSPGSATEILGDSKSIDSVDKLNKLISEYSTPAAMNRDKAISPAWATHLNDIYSLATMNRWKAGAKPDGKIPTGPSETDKDELKAIFDRLEAVEDPNAGEGSSPSALQTLLSKHDYSLFDALRNIESLDEGDKALVLKLRDNLSGELSRFEVGNMTPAQSALVAAVAELQGVSISPEGATTEEFAKVLAPLLTPNGDINASLSDALKKLEPNTMLPAGAKFGNLSADLQKSILAGMEKGSEAHKYFTNIHKAIHGRDEDGTASASQLGPDKWAQISDDKQKMKAFLYSCAPMIASNFPIGEYGYDGGPETTFFDPVDMKWACSDGRTLDTPHQDTYNKVFAAMYGIDNETLNNASHPAESAIAATAALISKKSEYGEESAQSFINSFQDNSSTAPIDGNRQKNAQLLYDAMQQTMKDKSDFQLGTPDSEAWRWTYQMLRHSFANEHNNSIEGHDKNSEQYENLVNWFKDNDTWLNIGSKAEGLNVMNDGEQGPRRLVNR